MKKKSCSSPACLSQFLVSRFNDIYFWRMPINSIFKTHVQANSVYKTPFFPTYKTPVRPCFEKEKLSKKLVVLKNTCFWEFWELFTLFFIYFFEKKSVIFSFLLDFLGSISPFRFRPFFFFFFFTIAGSNRAKKNTGVC